jgi:protein-L-isoaspartate(D-aspartate) O-methyltransferase
VFTIEIVEPLGKQAAEVLKRLGYNNVTARIGDGYRGWREEAPFDAIIVTCAPDAVPEPLVHQLAEGGRMIIPVGPEGKAQQLVLLKKKHGKLHQQEILPVRFVPMTGEARER